MLYKELGINGAGHLTFAGFDTVELAAEYGTPLMLLDEEKIRQRCRIYRHALETYFPSGSMALYASKALCFKGIYALAAQEGLGVDVVSTGELYTAYRAGFPMDKTFFHGNNKTDADIAFAMDHGVGYFVCDGSDEVAAIDAEAGRRGIRQKVLLRLTPGIDPHTHEKINTGRVDCKFGTAIETGQAERLLLWALDRPNIRVVGVHCHIGSQVFEAKLFGDAAKIMLEFLAAMKEKYSFEAQYLNLGGGLGVPYVATDPTIDYGKVLEDVAQLVAQQCRWLGLREPAILMEPGRSLVADAGMTVYTVGSVKQIPGFKNYVSVDGGMGDNPRYALYQAEYTILPADRMHDQSDQLWTVAGRCCESGDLIQENVPLPTPRRGDLLAVLTTGAYNYSMASNYNRYPRPPIVMLSKEGARLAVRRESLDDLLLHDL